MSDHDNNNKSDRRRTAAPPQPLARRLGRSGPLLAALACLAVIGLWMASGTLVVGGGGEGKTPPLKAAEGTAAVPQKRFRVGTRRFAAEQRNDVLHIRARTEAEQSVEVRAETAGRVESITGRKGQSVAKGAVLCKLDEGSRQALLAGARAQVEQAKADYEAGSKLSRSGYSAELNVAVKRAAYEAAAASLQQAEIDLANTTIKAPFDGIVEDQPAKVGDYLAVGGACAKLVRLDPLLVVGEVSEREVGRLKLGQNGRAELVTGERAAGRVRFIAPSAHVATRTFRVELEVPNRDQSMRNGVTADVHIPLEPVSGHRFSAGLLTLDDAGAVGVRAVTEGDIVRFLPVRILDQGKDGVFVAGLPREVTIITAGQDYVVDGQKVEAVPDGTAANESERKAGGADGRS